MHMVSEKVVKLCYWQVITSIEVVDFLLIFSINLQLKRPTNEYQKQPR